MFQRILVPLDGSARAEQALSVAAQFARLSNGTVILLRVVHLATEFWPIIPVPYGLPQVIIEDEQVSAECYLQALAHSPWLADTKTECLTAFGAVAPVIVSTAATAHADLIIMCSHSYMGTTRAIMGSYADTVARYTTIPTLIFHGRLYSDGIADSPGHMASPLRVLVPLDGSAHAEGALEPAITLLKQYQAAGRKVVLHLLRVVKPQSEHFMWDTERNQMAYQQELLEAKDYLQAQAQRLHRSTLFEDMTHPEVAITWSVSISKNSVETILRVSERGDEASDTGISEGCEYIVLATHGQGALHQCVMGSVAEHVLHLSRRPVLVVPSTSMLQHALHTAHWHHEFNMP